MSMLDKKANNSKKGLFTGVIIGCLAIAGGAYGYWHWNSQNNLDNKTPDQLVNISMEKLFENNLEFKSKYNFKVNYNPSDIIIDPEEPENNITRSQKDFSLSININGVVDKDEGKLEIVPVVTAKDNKETLSGTLPFQLDFKKMSITVDPATLRPFMDPVIQQIAPGESITSQYISLTMPKKYYQDFPLKELIQTLPQATQDAYNAFDKTHFSKEELDNKYPNAHYHIRLNTDFAELLKVNPAFIKSIQLQLANQAKSAKGDKKSAYDKILTGLKNFEEFNDKMDKMLTLSNIDDLKNSTYTIDFYLDQQARMIGSDSSFKYIDADFGNFEGNSETQYEYPKNPTFTIISTDKNTHNLDTKVLSKAIENLKAND